MGEQVKTDQWRIYIGDCEAPFTRFKETQVGMVQEGKICQLSKYLKNILVRELLRILFSYNVSFSFSIR